MKNNYFPFLIHDLLAIQPESLLNKESFFGAFLDSLSFIKTTTILDTRLTLQKNYTLRLTRHWGGSQTTLPLSLSGGFSIQPKYFGKLYNFDSDKFNEIIRLYVLQSIANLRLLGINANILPPLKLHSDFSFLYKVKDEIQLYQSIANWYHTYGIIPIIPFREKDLLAFLGDDEKNHELVFESLKSLLSQSIVLLSGVGFKAITENPVLSRLFANQFMCINYAQTHDLKETHLLTNLDQLKSDLTHCTAYHNYQLLAFFISYKQKQALVEQPLDLSEQYQFFIQHQTHFNHQFKATTNRFTDSTLGSYVYNYKIIMEETFKDLA